MKRSTYLIYSFVIISTSLFFFNSCQQDESIEVFGEEEYLKKIEVYEAKIKDLEEKLDLEKSSSRRPNNIISLRQAQSIYNAYDDRADLISETVSSETSSGAFQPTRSLFYEISELRNYLSYIDELSQKAGVKPTGLRFYFALYPENYQSSDGSTRNARHQTIFIAPTLEKKYNEQIVHIGYTLDNQNKIVFLDKDNGFSHLRRNRNKAKKNNAFDFLTQTKGSNNSLIGNELGASPPDYVQ
ncbi:hypothetical protein [Aquimarina sp. 2304DJ70-9]|uniref:hypothetical protein n=1 Tax=Aquimarina penaris TaxID=3231044 RepID=UPI003462FE5C